MLQKISEILKQYESARWDIFPEFDLYMDQLLGCLGLSLDVKLEDSATGSERFEISAHRVNNYVKQGFLPRPENRKYSREHLARLYMLRMTKGALPLPLLSGAVERLARENTTRDVSERFAEINDLLLKRIADSLENRAVFEQESESDLDYLALALAAEANALSLVSETILSRTGHLINHVEESTDDSIDSSSSSGR